ncbi:MAG: hypothetical protein Q8K92_24745 [Leadbetterella sp.]|nr:hypothetical protein [Leadbetterella sp.]
MKKIIYSFIFLSFSASVFAQQSNDATSTVSPNTNVESLSETKISTQREIGAKSVAVTNFSAFHEIAGAENSNSKVHLLIKETSNAYPRIRMIGSASTPENDRFWDIRGDVYEPTITDDFMFFKYGNVTYPSMSLNPNGKVGIGILTETKNLHVHENNTATVASVKLTTASTGAADTDGLELQILGNNDFLHPNAARVMNRENTQLFLGANNTPMVNITPTGNVGINSLFGGAPTARFQIFHDTEGGFVKPHINLVTSVDANNGMIKMSNLTASRYFGQYFNLNSGTAANNFLSFDYNGSTPILDLKGNGNVEIAGFTKLGSEPSAPKIKMKTITSTTGATEGSDSSFPHGLTASKIIDYSVLVEVAGGGVWVKSGHTHFTERQFDTEINTVNIRVYNNPTNSGNILSRPIKVVVTYTE